MDCIENFKTMQGCFREHPDEYGAELEDEEAEREYYEGENAETTARGEAAAAIQTTREGGDEVGVPKYPSGEPLSEPARKGLRAADSQSATEASPLSSSSSSATPVIPTPSPASLASSSPTEPSSARRAKVVKEQVAAQHGDPVSESEDIVPKAAHDARGSAQDGKL